MKSLAILVILLLMNIRAHSQVMQNLEDYPGKVQYFFNPVTGTNSYSPKIDTKEWMLLKMKFESIRKFMGTNPLIKQPKGIELVINTAITDKGERNSWLGSIRLKMEVAVYPWFIKDGKTDYQCEPCMKTFNIYFNDPEKLFIRMVKEESALLYDSSGSMISPEPQKIAEQNGCNIYDNGMVVISRSDAPLWIPLSVKEYNDILISEKQKLLKEKPDETVALSVMIAKINDETASYTKEELSNPAYTSDKQGASAEKAGIGSRPIVKLNPEYFDKKKPRNSIQLIILESGLIGNPDKKNPYYTNGDASFESLKTVEILKSMNYGGFRGFLN